MRILVAPQEFKGTLSASEAALAIADAARGARQGAAIDTLPLSDGGPGLVDVLHAALGGQRRHATVHDPLMRPVSAEWLDVDGVTAVIEMAAASGLVLVAEHERDALAATTFGTGELIRAAVDHGCERIILGIGGSATTDAGAGAMQAVGAVLIDAAGRDLAPGGAALAALATMNLAGVDFRLASLAIDIASDVRNTLCGPAGAARVYAPQKGASANDVVVLERALERFADVAAVQTGIDVRSMEGGGAAGGLACGLMLVAPAACIRPGFELVAGVLRLAERLKEYDLVITGEGRLDAQTGYGKTVAGVARLAHAAATPVIVVAGSIDASADLKPFAGVAACIDEGEPPPASRADAEGRLRDATLRALREYPPR